MQKNIIGVDLGATSGRVILARAGDDRLRMEELHRFPNRMREIDGRVDWDIHALYEEILRGLSVAGGRRERIDSIGIDTWGVDFACVDPDGDLLGLPLAYRDPYTDGVPEEVFRTVPRESVYAKTGIQVMNFNSLYQLYALNREHSPALAAAEHVLFMPDALSYLLTGEQVCEYTILSTSQLMNPRTRELDGELLRAAGVDASLFARRVMPGERVGVLRDEVARRTGLGRVEVFAVAGHDTASAIAAVPAADERFAYLSSGTWSLMGIELPAPVITEESCAMNFTNEGGVDGTTRFLKNITGMWLLEECRRIWAKEGRTYTYAEIMAMAAAAEPGRVGDIAHLGRLPQVALFGGGAEAVGEVIQPVADRTVAGQFFIHPVLRPALLFRRAEVECFRGGVGVEGVRPVHHVAGGTVVQPRRARPAVVVAGVEGHRLMQLAQLGLADGVTRLFPRHAERRQQDSGQDRNDCDHDEQLDQRKILAFHTVISFHWELVFLRSPVL